MNVNLEVVSIPVSDVDRAVQFYRDQLGWRVDIDINSGGSRVVEITPTGDGHASIVFGVPTAAPPGSMRHLELATPDIIAPREELAQRGVDVTEVYHGGASAVFQPETRIPGPDPDRTSYGSYASFADPDGNGWTLQEVTTRLPGREPAS
ncbi:VOC family protein [Asanoa sp. NPDC050611]|uniref:VOC family protein n=1 Tax=Asanoa sp. NPDC050611 TaxID=3157098 RepID=UPI0033DF3AAA